ncbi:MAG: RNA methyltransferase, partial [Flavobacterium sp.]
IIIMGNEANGISPEIERLVNQRISIPRFGKLKQTESLNVATAASIVISEFRRNFSGM